MYSEANAGQSGSADCEGFGGIFGAQAFRFGVFSVFPLFFGKDFVLNFKLIVVIF